MLSFASSVTHFDRPLKTLAGALGRANANVIPADAGIQAFRELLDPGFRRGDGAKIRDRIYEEEYLGYWLVEPLRSTEPGLADQ